MPINRPAPPITVISPIVVSRTASFTSWMFLVIRTAPIRPSSITGAAATMISACSVSLYRRRASARGFGGVERRLDLGSQGRVVVLAHGGPVRVGEHLAVAVHDDHAAVHLQGVAGDQPVELGPGDQGLAVEAGGDRLDAGQDLALLLGAGAIPQAEEQRDGQGHEHRDHQVAEGQDEAASDLHEGAANRKPTPRTVVMNSGSDGRSSSFLRSHEMWTSSVLVGPNQCGSQTSSMISSRRTT